jgi:hypothetical protein
MDIVLDDAMMLLVICFEFLLSLSGHYIGANAEFQV